MTRLVTPLVTPIVTRSRGVRRPRGDEGATAVEYGVLAALVVAIAVAAITLLGNRISGGFDRSCAPLPSAAVTTSGTPAPVVC